VSVFKNIVQNGKYQFIPFFTTILVILGIDLFGLIPSVKGEGLIIGVVAGLIAAIGAILHGNLKNSYFFDKSKHREGDVITIHLAEEVSFLNKASIRATLDHLPANSIVVIDAGNTHYIDFDVLGLIKEFRDIKAPVKNIQCSTRNFKESYNIDNSYSISSGH
jgi:MFS superfamily sulfate permease-like transporter